MVKIGQKIKAARKRKQITQEDLARVVGVSDKSISAYESERAQPPIQVLEKIAKNTDQSLSYFLDEEKETTIITKLRNVETQLMEIKALLKKQK